MEQIQGFVETYGEEIEGLDEYIFENLWESIL